MQSAIIKALASLKSSTHRSNVLSGLVDKMMTPADMSKSTGLHISHVSKALSELKALKLVTCLNEDDMRGRFYEATKFGKDVWKVYRE